MTESTVVLDASGVFRSTLDFSKGGFIIPESTYSEIRAEAEKTAVEEAIRRGDIKVVMVCEKSLAIVRKAAEHTGDIVSLSSQDLDVLAAAIGHNALINSDDYAIQNTAAELGLNVVGTSQEGIRKKVIWAWACSGCGKRTDGPGTCEVCGHKARKKPRQI
jgi:endoribonuclease Nob1